MSRYTQYIIFQSNFSITSQLYCFFVVAVSFLLLLVISANARLRGQCDQSPKKPKQNMRNTEEKKHPKLPQKIAKYL